VSGCRVLVVDNDPFILTSLVNALENSNIVVVGRAGTAREALRINSTAAADVALLDLDLGVGPTGIDLAHALRIHAPEIGLVLLSSYRDPRLLVPGMPKPPRGMAYLSKSQVNDFAQIAATVRSAAIAPFRDRPHAGPRGESLTTAQLEVLALVAKGKTTQVIADLRGVGPKAVEATISRLSEILGIPRDGSINQRVRLTRAYFELAGKIDGDGAQ
jgi:DNA-binding NarL/FixJ family response regulator